jgi:hypothetical protein
MAHAINCRYINHFKFQMHVNVKQLCSYFKINTISFLKPNSEQNVLFRNASLEGVKVVGMRTAFCWKITPRHRVIGSRHFEGSYC